MPSFSISCTKGLRLIIVHVHVRAVKIYVTAVEALLKKKEAGGLKTG
jgi:hypothetical protein